MLYTQADITWQQLPLIIDDVDGALEEQEVQRSIMQYKRLSQCAAYRLVRHGFIAGDLDPIYRHDDA